MKNKIPLLSLVFLSFVFMFMTVSAQPPFQEISATNEESFIIEFPKIEIAALNYDYNFYAHIYYNNGTSIVSTDNNSVICHLNGHNQSGALNYDEELQYLGDDLWYSYVPASFFNWIGAGYYTIHCINSTTNVIGSVSNPFFVTVTGTELSVGQSIIYGVLFLVLIMFFIVSLYGIFKIENVAWKVGSMCFGWIVLMSIFLVGWLFALYYVPEIPYFQTVMYIMWLVMMYGFFAFLLALSTWLMFRAFQETQEKKFVRMGYSNEEARIMSRRKRK